MFQNIADIAILTNGAIFGGYVRDFVLKDECAQQFYTSNKKGDFSNPEVSPETSDRLLIPSDIDIHFKTLVDYKKFRTALNKGFYVTNVVMIENLYTSGPYTRHFKLVVRLGSNIGTSFIREILNNCLPEYTVNIDAVISQGNPPFNNDLDFECNGLIMDKTGIHLCTELIRGLGPMGVHRTFTRVLNDIKHKRALVVNFNPKRWDKMADKPNNWEILGSTVEKIRSTADDRCVICLENISEDVHKFHCCKGCYHSACLTKAIVFVNNSGTCPHCRRELYLPKEIVTAFGV